MFKRSGYLRAAIGSNKYGAEARVSRFRAPAVAGVDATRLFAHLNCHMRPLMRQKVIITDF